MVNFRGLEALCAFVQSGSILKAAERMGRTAPQVGRLLTSLESELGFALFDRRTKPIELTKDGRTFALQAQVALAGVERLDQIARHLQSFDRYHLRILTSPFLASALVMDAIASLAGEFPQLTAEIDSRIRLDIEEWIEKESFDLGIASLPIHSSAFRTERLIDVEAMCALHREHPLAAQPIVDFDMLRQHQLVLQHPRSKVRTFVEGLAREQNVPLNVRYEAPNGLIAAQMAGRGLGCGIADPLIAMSAGEPDLMLRPFLPKLVLQYAFVFPTWAANSTLVTRLAAEIRRAAAIRMESLTGAER